MLALAMRTGRISLLVYLLLMNVPSGAQAKMIENGRLYRWNLFAYTNDVTGRFNHCAASVPYRSGISLFFAIDRSFNWSMGLANPVWRLTPGVKYKIQYQIDDAPPINAVAVANSAELAEVGLLDSESLFTRFQRGWFLKVRAEGEEFVFALNNSSKVLAAALECARRYTTLERLNTNPNPFVGRTPPTDQDAAKTNQLRAEAVAVAANLLAASGIHGFEVARKIPPQLAMFHAVWRMPGMVGGLRIEENETVDSTSVAVIAKAAEQCRGSFASVKLPSADADGVRMKTACLGAQTDTNEYVYFNLVKRQQGGTFVFVVLETKVPGEATPEAGEAAEESGRRIFEAALKVVPRR